MAKLTNSPSFHGTNDSQRGNFAVKYDTRSETVSVQLNDSQHGYPSTTDRINNNQKDQPSITNETNDHQQDQTFTEEEATSSHEETDRVLGDDKGNVKDSKKGKGEGKHSTRKKNTFSQILNFRSTQ